MKLVKIFILIGVMSQAGASASDLHEPLTTLIEPVSALLQQRDRDVKRNSYVYDSAIYSVSETLVNSGYRTKFGRSGKQGYGVGVAVLDGRVNCLTGYIKNCTSYTFTDSVHSDFDDHGTHVAGLIAGKYGPMLLGMANQSDIYGYAVFDDTGYRGWSNVRYSVEHAVNTHNVKVMNLSFGPTATGVVAFPEEVSFFTGANYVDKVLVVKSAGNDGVNLQSIVSTFLAANHQKLSNIIIVGALNQEGGAIASFSNRPGESCFKNGTKACVESSKLKYYFMVAPGVNSLSILKDGSLGLMSGTSMAAPTVSGAAALIFGRWPTLRPGQVRDILFRTADDLGVKGVDAVYGRGALNIAKALSPVGTTTARTTNGASLKVSRNSFIKGGSFAGGVSTPPVMFDDFGRDFSILQQNSPSVSGASFRSDFSVSDGPWQGTFMVALERETHSSAGSSDAKFLGIRLANERITYHSGVRPDAHQKMYFSERSNILKPYFFNYKLMGISTAAGNFVTSAQRPTEATSSSAVGLFFEPGSSPMAIGLLKETSGFYGLSTSENLGFSAPSNSLYVGVESELTAKSAIRAEILLKPQGARSGLVSYRSSAVIGGAYSQTFQNTGVFSLSASKKFLQDYKSDLVGFQVADISPLEIAVSLKNFLGKKVTSDLSLKAFSNGKYQGVFSLNAKF